MFFEKLCVFLVSLCVIAISQSFAENLKVAQSLWVQDEYFGSSVHQNKMLPINCKPKWFRY